MTRVNYRHKINVKVNRSSFFPGARFPLKISDINNVISIVANINASENTNK